MTYRDQLEFKIRKLTRAIDAVADLGADFNLTAGVVETLRKLRQKRADLRRTVATGSRCCGECGNPMSRVVDCSSLIVHRCETTDCLGRDSVDIVRV